MTENAGPNMAAWAAQMQAEKAAFGDKQGPLDGMINKGAQNNSLASLGLAKGNVPAFQGTGRGFFGKAGDTFISAVLKQADAYIAKVQAGAPDIQPPTPGNSDFIGPGPAVGGSFASGITPPSGGSWDLG